MRALASLLLICIAGCTSQAAPARSDAQPGATLGQIRALIGSAACTDSSQCHALPVGARGCGGPESYLPWSSVQTSGNALHALAERHKAERQAQIAAKGEVSNCMFMADPGAVCRAGTCQLGTGLPER